jgi:hypothetical protein
MICSELTLAILNDAQIATPAYLDRKLDYKPTPIDVTRWLLGRYNWRDADPTGPVLRGVKKALGVHYRIRVQGPER